MSLGYHCCIPYMTHSKLFLYWWLPAVSFGPLLGYPSLTLLTVKKMGPQLYGLMQGRNHLKKKKKRNISQYTNSLYYGPTSLYSTNYSVKLTDIIVCWWWSSSVSESIMLQETFLSLHWRRSWSKVIEIHVSCSEADFETIKMVTKDDARETCCEFGQFTSNSNGGVQL